MNKLKGIINKVLGKAGLVRASSLNQKLKFAHNVSRRLDEHRKFVENISLDTNLFQTNPAYIQQMAEQDNYLMHLFFLLNGHWPEANKPYRKGYVKARPQILGTYECAKAPPSEDKQFIRRYAPNS